MEILDFEKYKATIHSALLSRIDLEKLAAAGNGKARTGCRCAHPGNRASRSGYP